MNNKIIFKCSLLCFALELNESIRYIRHKLKFMQYIKSWRDANDDRVQRYCEDNSNRLATESVEFSSSIVLIDCFPIPQWVMVNGLLSSLLAKREKARIVSYGVSKRDPYTDKIYRSFGCREHILVRIDRQAAKLRRSLFVKMLSEVRTKQDLISLRIDGITIGLDIYESILRTGVPTVNVKSLRTKIQIFDALRYYLSLNGLYSKGLVKCALLSHDCYVGIGLVSKMAYRYGSPVYFANPFEFIKTDRPQQIYEKFMKYPDYFESLSETKKSAAIMMAEKCLQQRLGGVVGVNMSYQEKSAFTTARLKSQTLKSNKLKIVVATHCFFDNPHAYGGLLFNDFYEWLEFLGRISSITDYEWYIKPHPDYLPGTIEILSNLTRKFPKLKLIDPSTTFHQLKDEGVTVALTCYGSIGHELPLLGYKVINAGYNPHIAYPFNIHPKSIIEYEDILLHLTDISDPPDVKRIFEFYYIHYFYCKPDDFFFDSYDKFLSDAGGDPSSLQTYESYLAQISTNEYKIVEKMNKFISSGMTYSHEVFHP